MSTTRRGRCRGPGVVRYKEYLETVPLEKRLSGERKLKRDRLIKRRLSTIYGCYDPFVAPLAPLWRL